MRGIVPMQWARDSHQREAFTKPKGTEAFEPELLLVPEAFTARTPWRSP